MEDLLIDLPVLRQLHVHKKSLLEKRRDLLDETDCESVRNGALYDKIGRVRRLMIALLNRIQNDALMAPVSLGNEETAAVKMLRCKIGIRKTAVAYFDVRGKKDPFPD